MAETFPDFSILPDLALINILSHVDHPSLLNCLVLNSRIKNLAEKMRKEEFKNGISLIEAKVWKAEIKFVPAVDWDIFSIVKLPMLLISQFEKFTPINFRWLKISKMSLSRPELDVLGKIDDFLLADLKKLHFVFQGEKHWESTYVAEYKRIVKNSPRLEYLGFPATRSPDKFVDLVKSVDCRAYRPRFDLRVSQVTPQLMDAFLSMDMRCDHRFLHSFSSGTDPDQLHRLMFQFLEADVVARPRRAVIGAAHPVIKWQLMISTGDACRRFGQVLRETLSDRNSQLEVLVMECFLDVKLTKNGIIRNIKASYPSE